MSQENSNLVSVIVAVYNNEKYIYETLESIYKQTYNTIELIICDDYSTDNTVQIIEQWMSSISRDRFYALSLIKREKNLGLTGNLNEGIKISNGSWIKCLGGDDILLPNGIEVLFGTFGEKPLDILFGQAVAFYTDKDGKKIEKVMLMSADAIEKFSLSSKGFFEALITKCFLPAPAALFSKQLWNELDGFDTRYKMMEDWPFWLKAAENHKKFFFLDKTVVMYRQHDDSITSKKLTTIDDEIGNQSRLDSINFSYDFRRHYISNIFEKWEIINLFYATKIFTSSSYRPRIVYFIFRATSLIYVKNIFLQYIKN